MGTKHATHQGRIKTDKALVKPWAFPQIQRGLGALYLLDQFAALTSEQIARALFYRQPSQRRHPRSLASARKAANEMCLRRLKDLGLVELVAVPREQFNPQILLDPITRYELNILTARGAKLLQEEYTERFGSYPLRWTRHLRKQARRASWHTLEIINLGVTILAHARLEGWELLDWHTDAQLKGLPAKDCHLGELEPDAFFVLRKEECDVPFFLEIDRGTEGALGDKPNSWYAKMRKYGRYLKERYPTDPYFQRYPTKPKVLTITTSAVRLQSLLDATSQAGGENTYYFALRRDLDPLLSERADGSMELVAPDLLGATWDTPTSTTPVALRDHLERCFSLAGKAD